MTRILELGCSEGSPIPRPFQPNVSPKVWVKFRSELHAMQGDGFVLGRKCISLSELQTVIDQLKSDLDEVLREAKIKFDAND